MGLLAAEITARTGRDPQQFYEAATEDLGKSFYARIDAAASREQKKLLAALDPAQVEARELAGEPIEAKLSRAPGNNQAIGGIKLVTKNGWFAARPSGTEDVYKIYAESFRSEDHLKRIQEEAQALISRVFSKT
jgi:phosphoglucomutase